MSWLAAATLAAGFLSSRSQRRSARSMERMSREQFEENKKLFEEQEKLLNIERDKYRSQVFVNPFDNIENPFEDLTVNTEQAEFLSRRAEQAQANILSTLRDAAGASGIAGLAQTLANQNMLANQKISADIAKQEGANRLAAAKSNLSIQLAERKGEAMVQNMEASQTATLLGMQQAMTGVAAANMGQAQANQMSANLAGNQLRTSANQTMLSAFSSKPVQKFLKDLE
tara:strand:+ start:9560 stop:10243 length:684 start_codon:yes stop_codon:yes gene_type:complete